MGVRGLFVLVFRKRRHGEQDEWLSPSLTEKYNIKEDSTRKFRKITLFDQLQAFLGSQKPSR